MSSKDAERAYYDARATSPKTVLMNTITKGSSEGFEGHGTTIESYHNDTEFLADNTDDVEDGDDDDDTLTLQNKVKKLSDNNGTLIKVLRELAESCANIKGNIESSEQSEKIYEVLQADVDAPVEEDEQSMEWDHGSDDANQERRGPLKLKLHYDPSVVSSNTLQ